MTRANPVYTGVARRREARLVLPWICVLAAACAGDGPDPEEEIAGPQPGERLTVDFDRDVQPIFEEHCSCHLSVSAPQGVVLLAGSSFHSLVGRVSTENDALLLVEPFEPERSYLMIKLDDAIPDVRELRRGTRMPPERPPLDPADLDTIRRWINEGAEPRVGEEDTESELDRSPPLFEGADRAVAVSASAIDLFWQGAMDDRTTAASILYRIYTATTSGAQDFTRPAVVSGAGVTRERLRGLEEDTTYFIVVRAVDEAGNEDGNEREVSAHTFADSTPSEPTGEDRFPRDSEVERLCSLCHGIRIVLLDGTRGEITPPGQGFAFFPPDFFLDAAVRSAELWAATVSRMRRENGAQLTDAEEEHVVEYFVENFSEPSP